MKSRPIIMRADEARAILDNRKTQFRRPVKWPVLSACDGSKRRVYTERDAAEMNERLETRQRHPSHQFCPHGQPGDQLWVRETWRQFDAGIECACYVDCFCRRYHGKPIYRADSDSEDKWRPSVHMPRWASRITLEIVCVRVERVQEITNEDCWNEGMSDQTNPQLKANRKWFSELWENTHGKEAWTSNPWVWVVEFRRTK